MALLLLLAACGSGGFRPPFGKVVMQGAGRKLGSGSI
jgi:hypothetical protein